MSALHASEKPTTHTVGPRATIVLITAFVLARCAAAGNDSETGSAASPLDTPNLLSDPGFETSNSGFFAGSAGTAVAQSDPQIRLIFVDQYTPFMSNQPTVAFPSPTWVAANGGADLTLMHVGGNHPKRLASIYAGELAGNAIRLSDLATLQ